MVECETGYECNDGTCTDIDECVVGGHDCHTFEVCENTDGAWDCLFDHTLCDPNEAKWRGANKGKVVEKGDHAWELRVAVKNSDGRVNIRSSPYTGFLIWDRSAISAKVFFRSKLVFWHSVKSHARIVATTF